MFPRSDASVAALGLFRAVCEREKSEFGRLALPFTNYNKTVLYNKYDITDFLRRGENEIEIVVGDGWCNQNAPDEWGFSVRRGKTVNKMIFSARVGDKEIVSRRMLGRFAPTGPVYRSALRLGEFHDKQLNPVLSVSRGKMRSAARQARKKHDARNSRVRRTEAAVRLGGQKRISSRFRQKHCRLFAFRSGRQTRQNGDGDVRRQVEKRAHRQQNSTRAISPIKQCENTSGRQADAVARQKRIQAAVCVSRFSLRIYRGAFRDTSEKRDGDSRSEFV